MRALLIGALLSLAALVAQAQAPVSVCATNPAYFGCYPAAGTMTPGATFPLVTANGPRTLSVGSLLGQIGRTDLVPPTTVQRTVFVGGVSPHFAALADPAGSAQMLAAGNIGLYEHANGLASLSAQQLAALYATWGLPATGAARRSVGEIGAYAPVPASYLALFGTSYPVEANMNAITGSGDGSGSYQASSSDAAPGTPYSGYLTSSDLATIETAIGAAFTAGARNVAPVFTPNGGGEDIVDAFASGGYWANNRAAALYGGALALDVPPSYWWARGPVYQAFIVGELQWAAGLHLRTSLIVSPHALQADAAGNSGPCGYDPNLLSSTQRLWAALKSAGAMPSQWIVENYCTSGTENDWAGDATPGSLNQVALFLARATTNSAPGTATPGGGGAAELGLTDATVATSPVRLALPTVRVGPLRIGDIAGAGSMASQDAYAVMITGGTIDTTAITSATITGSTFNGGSIGATTRPSLIATTNLDTSGAVAVHGLPSSDPHVLDNLWVDSSNVVHRSTGP